MSGLVEEVLRLPCLPYNFYSNPVGMVQQSSTLVFASSPARVTRCPELFVEFEVLRHSMLPQARIKNVAR